MQSRRFKKPNNVCRFFLFFVTIFLSCADTPLEFIPVEQIMLSQTVEIPTIYDYENIVNQKKITIVYYTNEYFIIDVNSVMYLLRSRGYKNFHDYKEGRLAEPEPNSIFKPGYPLKRR